MKKTKTEKFIEQRKKILKLIDLDELRKISEKHIKSIQFQTEKIYNNFIDEITNHIIKKIIKGKKK